MTPRLSRVILYGKPFAYRVRRNVLGSQMTEFAVVHLSLGARLIGELHVVVTRDSPQVIVVSDPIARFNFAFRGRPGTTVCKSPE
jgi:hypothetical protein